MLIGIMFGLWIIGLILLFVALENFDGTAGLLTAILGTIMVLGGFIILFVGIFNGFINYPPTEGTHQGIVTAVDLEGVHFRRYEVYLKSGEYTGQSDETKYLLYEYETELAEELKNAIGKMVKIHYGHDGGYIGWKSCGTYHIKSIEIIESEE